MKKLSIFTMAIVIVFFSVSNASASIELNSFIAKDVSTGHWAYEEVDLFLSAEMINGTPDKYGNYFIKPNDQVTRAQFTKMLVNALGWTGTVCLNTFKDVKYTDWYYEHVQAVACSKIVNGYEDNTLFKPYEKITRAQMTAMIAKAFDYIKNSPEKYSHPFKDIPKGYWAADSIAKAYNLGVVKGSSPTTFKPSEYSTRAQAIVMLSRALHGYNQKAPTAETIKEKLSWILNDELRIYEEGNFLDLRYLYKNSALGYYKAYGWYWMEQWNTIQFNGHELKFKGTHDFEITPIEIGNRIAVLDIKGLNYDYTKDGREYKLNHDGRYYLIYDRIDDRWKIFNYYPSDKLIK